MMTTRYIILTFLVTLSFIALPVMSSPALAEEFRIELDENLNVKQEEEKEEKPFYDVCMEIPAHPAVSEENKLAQCACMDAKMSEIKSELNNENKIGKSFFDTSALRAEEKLSEAQILAEVHTPCIYTVVQDIAFDKCFHDRRLFRFVKSEEQLTELCTCVGTGIQDYVEEYAYFHLAPEFYEEKKIRYDIYELLHENGKYLKDVSLIKDNCFTEFTTNYRSRLGSQKK